MCSPSHPLPWEDSPQVLCFPFKPFSKCFGSETDFMLQLRKLWKWSLCYVEFDFRALMAKLCAYLFPAGAIAWFSPTERYHELACDMGSKSCNDASNSRTVVFKLFSLYVDLWKLPMKVENCKSDTHFLLLFKKAACRYWVQSHCLRHLFC